MTLQSSAWHSIPSMSWLHTAFPLLLKMTYRHWKGSLANQLCYMSWISDLCRFIISSPRLYSLRRKELFLSIVYFSILTISISRSRNSRANIYWIESLMSSLSVNHWDGLRLRQSREWCSPHSPVTRSTTVPVRSRVYFLAVLGPWGLRKWPKTTF